jgi:hypothetical protein
MVLAVWLPRSRNRFWPYRAIRSSDGRRRGAEGGAAALGHPCAEDLLADVLDLDRPGLVGQVGERGLRGDQAVEQVQLVVLEADVEHVGLAAGRHVAPHLERHGGLAGALGPADQQELSGAHAAAHGLVERGEPERHGLVLAHLAAGHLFVQVDEHLDGRPGRHAPVRTVKPPGRPRRSPRFRRHAQSSSRSQLSWRAS